MKKTQKCSLPSVSLYSSAAHLAEPVIEAGEDREHRAERQHVMEVRDDVIGVVHVRIDAGVRQHDAGDAADGEHEDEADRPQHRRLEADASRPTSSRSS